MSARRFRWVGPVLILALVAWSTFFFFVDLARWGSDEERAARRARAVDKLERGCRELGEVLIDMEISETGWPKGGRCSKGGER